jgi:hypothetical protein
VSTTGIRGVRGVFKLIIEEEVKVDVPIENGLPKYIRLKRTPIPRRCPRR